MQRQGWNATHFWLSLKVRSPAGDEENHGSGRSFQREQFGSRQTPPVLKFVSVKYAKPAEWQILCFAEGGRWAPPNTGLKFWLWAFISSDKACEHVCLKHWDHGGLLHTCTHVDFWCSVMKKGDEIHQLLIDLCLWYGMAPSCCYDREM